MIRQGASLFLLLMLCAVEAVSDPSQELFEDLAKCLIVGSSLQGIFQQEKHLAFLQKPLISSGEFSVDRSTGVQWRVTKPLESIMLVQGSRVVLDGQPVKDHGIGQLMATIMLGFMEGDLSGVGKYFQATGEVAEGGWYLSLEPLSPGLQTILEHIDLRGSEYLREIVISEPGENRTTIFFSEVTSIDTEMSGSNVISPQ